MRERDLLDLLHHRYPTTYSGVNPPRYIFIEHPIAGSIDDTHAVRNIDAIALDRYLTAGVRAVHGFEVKTSRDDWLRELRNADKAGSWVRYCHRFWVVAADKAIVKPGELPRGWGLMAPGPGGRLEIVTPAKPNKNVLPLPGVADLVWRAIKTDRERRR